ncbi:MAG: M12 family metallo-peptidase, partial [Planctomycetota bacterium]
MIALLVLAAMLLPAPRAAAADAMAGPALAPETAREKNTRLLRHATLAPLPIGDRVILEDFEFGDGRTVDLDLERFDVFTPDAVVIDATPFGEVEMPRPDVVLLRGHVAGDPEARVFLGIGPDGTHGYVRDGETLQVVSSGPYGPDLGENFAVEVTNALDLAHEPEGPPTCGNDPDDLDLYPLGLPAPPENPADGSPPPCRSARLAMDSDWVFTGNLFGGNTTASSAYITTLVGALSEIYEENFSTEFTMPYLRVFSTSADPYTVTSDTSTALVEFRDHWRNTKSHIGRELAHLVSGKSLGGGIAYVNVVCNTQWGFGLSANMNGTFPYPLQDHHFQNWDINVVAHEVGHNFGTGHTHDYNPPIDGCGNADCSASYGGTIMSYCHICPGGMSNIVLEFHPTVIAWVMTMLDAIPCDLSVSCPVADPGLYVGASGGSWFVGSNWNGGSVPSGSTDVTIPTLVLVDSPGAVASTVTISSGGTLEMANGTATLTASTLTIDSGGALTGVGTVTAAVDNSGTVAPGVSPTNIGTLAIASTFTQQAGGALAIDIDGYTPGSQHDLLTVTTTATIGGGLTATVTGGFTPALQDVDFIAATTLTGTWATTSLPADLPGAYSFVSGTDSNSAYLVTVGVETCGAPTVSLWASEVIGFTSQYGNNGFSAAQALGAPDVFTYGNDPLAWASANQNGSLEHITLGFGSLVYATGVTVRETLGNGFVTRVDVLDLDDQYQTVWTGGDPSAQGAPADFLIQWAQTSYLVKGVRIYVDTGATTGWEEIDAVQIHGVPGPNDEWADHVIDFSSEWSSTIFAATEALGAPDVLTYGNDANAWAPSSQDGTLEYLTVGFATPVFATGVTVRETWGNGFVYAIDVVDTSDQLHAIWSGTDPSSAGAPAEFRINWPQTGYLVKGVRVHVDTDASADWEEIDAVRLHGILGAVADCNGNGVLDNCDLLAGISADLNADGIPDDCDLVPGIDSLSATPDPLPSGQTLTLTANGVADPNNDVTIVRFYRDLDDDGELDGSDTLLGSDSSASGGWTWSGSTNGYPVGPMRFFAQAEDGAALTSAAVGTIVDVQTAYPAGLYIGAPGGSWFVGANWGGGVVPGAGTAVVIDGSVALDGAGAQAASVTIQDGGTLTFSSGGTLAVSSGVTVESGGTLTGAGTITGDVVNGGLVAPGAPVGTLTVTGTYTQQAAATLDIGVDGYTAGTQHDVLAVGGVGTLAGTLDVATLGSFTPSPGGTVQLLTAASIAGAFDTANLPTLGGGNSFVRQQNATNETLVTVAVADCTVPEVLQWANSVIDFSSEWSTHWFGSMQMLGAPDVFAQGINKYGWTASSANGSVEHVTLG